jgi:hypothetical protein
MTGCGAVQQTSAFDEGPGLRRADGRVVSKDINVHEIMMTDDY